MTVVAPTKYHMFRKNPFLVLRRSRQITIDPDFLFDICYREFHAGWLSLISTQRSILADFELDRWIRSSILVELLHVQKHRKHRTVKL